MVDDWQYYFCSANGKPASVFLNLSLAEMAPKTSHPILAAIKIDMNSPREDGLSSSEEASSLYRIEEALTNALSTIDAIYAGRITVSGRRDFYFYLSKEEEFPDLVETAMVTFPRYEWQSCSQNDHEWTFYKDILYPSTAAQHSIENRKVINALKEAGDEATTARPLFHCSHFINESDRSCFSAWAKSVGFIVTFLAPVANKSGKRWGIAFERQDPLDLKSLDILTAELETRTAQFNGDYDGWECEVIVASVEFDSNPVIP